MAAAELEATTESALEGNTKPPPSSRSVLKPTRSADVFFGPAGRKAMANMLDLAVVKLVCVASLPPRIADLPEWKFILRLNNPSYTPASRTTLMDVHIMSEQERVRELQVAYLKTQDHLAISFDGATTRAGESVFTVHITTPPPERRAVLLEGRECTRESHTGEFIASLVIDVSNTIISTF